ncbi:MAG: PF20097 family protein [Clostridium sp.]|uniref:PF20097 family protein n=1 Tax=Clostridium sp. TaxID=1506 RepID=UPI003D6CB6FA
MKCPYCGNEMKNGAICGGRDNLKFIADKAKKRFGIFPVSIKLTSLWGGKLISHYCENCRKIIIDIEQSST